MDFETVLLRECLDGSESRFQFWERAVTALGIEQMAEVGVWKGDFAAHVLAKCLRVHTYFMVDAWRHLDTWNKPFNVDNATFEANFREAIEKTDFAKDRRVVLRGTSAEVIDQIPDASLDLAYLDADRTLRGITIDCLNLYPKLRPGGYLAGNGMVPDIWEHGADFEPTLVFPFVAYFAEAIGALLLALPFRQYLMRKPSARERGSYEYVDTTQQLTDCTVRGRFAVRGEPA